jgi:predicted metal-dependent hydrolase
MNHGRRFWSHVMRVCPDHRALRAELNEVGRRLLLMPIP